MRSLLLMFLIACTPETPAAAPASQPAQPTKGGTQKLPDEAPEGLEIATLAGGCFWCMEKPIEVLPGVVSVVSGYTDGHVPHATYKQVGGGRTGHTEGVRVTYDPKKLSFPKLLEVFWRNIDPTQANGQFCDRGPMYRTGIYFHSPAQKAAAQKSKLALEASGKLPGKIVTEVKAASPFYAAEDYHQDFYKKKPGHYGRYRIGCGRDARLLELWGPAQGH